MIFMRIRYGAAGWLIGLIWCIGSCVSGAETTPETAASPEYRILILNSSGGGSLPMAQVFNSFQKNMARRTPHYVLDCLEVNAESHNPTSYRSQIRSTLKALGRGEYDLVMAIHDDAVHLLLDHITSLPARVPAVLYADSALFAKFRARHPNTTGLLREMSVVRTLAAGLNLFPDTRNVLLVVEPTGPASEIRKAVLEYSRAGDPVRLNVVDGGAFNKAELRELVRRLPKQSLVMLVMGRDAAQKGFSDFSGWARDLLQNAPVPVLVTEELLLDSGAVGGFVTGGVENSRILADLVGRVRPTGNAGNVPAQPEKHQLVLNMPEIQKYRVPMSLVPRGAILKNPAPVAPVSHGHQIGIGIAWAVSLFLGVLLLGVWRSRNYWRRQGRFGMQLPVGWQVASPEGRVYCRSNNEVPDAAPPTESFIRQVRGEVLRSLRPVWRRSIVSGQWVEQCWLPLNVDDELADEAVLEAVLSIPCNFESGERLTSGKLPLALILLEQLPLPLVVRDAGANFKILWCNDAYANLVGKKRPVLLAHPDDSSLDYDGSELKMNAENHKVMNSGAPLSRVEEFAPQGADGVRAFQHLKYPLRQSEGENLLVEIFADITTQRRRSRVQTELAAQQNWQIEHLHWLNQCMLKLAAEPHWEQAENEMLRLLALRLGADRVTTFRFAATDLRPEPVASFSVSGTRTATDREPNDSAVNGFYEILCQHIDIRIDDTENPPETLAATGAAAAKSGVRALLTGGIWVKDHLWGFTQIEFLHTTHLFNENDVKIFHDFRMLQTAIRSKFRRLRRMSEVTELREIVFDRADIAWVLYDANKRRLLTNSYCRRIFGGEKDGERCGSHFCDRGNALSCCGVTCPLDEALLRRETLRRMVRLKDMNFQMTVQPILGDDGEVRYLLSSLVECPGQEIQPAQSVRLDNKHISPPLRKWLLVDDVTLNRKVETRMLKTLGGEVTAVSSGEEALEAFSTAHFDAVLTDLWMPGMNGEVLAMRLRQLPGGVDCRIYAVTADADAENEFSLRDFDGLFHKPLTLSVLNKLINPVQ